MPGAVHTVRMDESLVRQVREAFGWDDQGEVAVEAGPRGALGQIWRIEVGKARYALKELFDDAPPEASIHKELEFARRAAEAGVRLPACYPDRDGRFVTTVAGGKQLRLYEWMDLSPLDPADEGTPAKLGVLLARLHRCAPAATEPIGRWYDYAPDPHAFREPSTSDAAWAKRLADRIKSLPELCATITPADPTGLVVCHRDLHPENVLADNAGQLVVVDWDNLGPADPSRELAQVLFDWYCDGPVFDLSAMQNLYQAYLDEDGPARISEPADFSMLLASRLNFLLLQARIALDPGTEPRHLEWAEREIDEALRILPTAKQLTDVLATMSGSWSAPHVTGCPVS